VIPNDHRKKYLEGFYIQVINSSINKRLVKNLKSFLDKIDQRRGTDWKKLYPFISEAIEKESK
jgi:hypothetical protein